MPEVVQTRVADILADKRWADGSFQNERTLILEREGVNREGMTADFSFASELPVDRWYGREILSIDDKSCDLTRLNNGGAFLVNHDWSDQVGVVTKAWIDASTKKARCTVLFSQSTRGKEIFDDIARGIRRLVSVGYVVRNMQLTEKSGEVETYRVTDWQAFEVSTVPVPADPSVGQGRSKPASVSPISISTSMAETTTATETRTSATVTQDFTAERQRMKDINAAAKHLAERHPDKAQAFRDLALKCSETGDTLDAFNRCVLNDILGTERTLSPVTQDPNAAVLGLNAKDRKRFSILRAARLICDNKPLDGLERECDDELTNKLGRRPRGFFVPDEILADRRSQRALTAGSPLDGGYTVGQQILTAEFENYLRNNTVVAKLGARVIGGLVGDVSIPRQLTGAAAYWVSEAGSITQSGATFGQIVSKPRRIGTSVPYSKQFMAQTSLDAESFVVNDSDEATALDIDRVALRGTGATEPLGIANLATGDRSTSVTFGAAPTWPKYLEFFSSIATNNAIQGSPAYAASVASAVKAMATAKFSNTGIPIWENGRVGAFRAEWTTQLLTSATPVANMVIFGDFSQVLMLEWAGRDVVVDPYTGKKEGTVEITIQRLMDVVIRRAKSFAISADSGAQ